MVPDELSYSRGASYSGFPFYLGILIIAASIFQLINTPVIELKVVCGIIILLAWVPLMALRGIKIDHREKILFEYFNFLLFKITYRRTKLDEYDTVYLRLYSRDTEFVHGRIASNTMVYTREYELFFRNKIDGLLFFETTNYDQARKVLQEVSMKLQFEAVDGYKEKRAK